MAFKGLEDRFLSAAKTLYNHASTRDDGMGGLNSQPYLEWKPTDPNAEETANDSRTVPVGSTKRDITRLTKFSTSGQGILWLAQQELLQTGNTFSETRIINPLFVVGNAVPGVHLGRSLTGQSDFAVKGDSSQESPASLNPQIFSAGRLQISTSNTVKTTVMNTGGSKGLLGLLSLSGIVDTLKGLNPLKDVGTLGVNERPELDIDGQYYSEVLWTGYQKTYGVQSNFASALANLRIGNFSGAFNSIKNGVDNLINGVASATGAKEPRGNLSADYDGRRYFFEVDGTDYRYLPKSVGFTVTGDGHEVPVVQAAYLHHQPYTLPTVDAPTPGVTINPVAAIASSFAGNSFSVSNVISSGLGNIISNVVNKIKLPFNINVPILGSFNANALSNISSQLKNLASGGTTTHGSSAEDNMQFSALSLSNRYDTDERLTFIRDQLDAQKNSSFAYWNAHKSTLGFDTSTQQILIGQENTIDPTTRITSHFVDQLNLLDVIDAGDDGVDETTLNTIQEYGQDLINVIFYDLVNTKAVPFRAFVSGISENIIPEINDTRYVGRIERNIVYSGVVREVSFQLRVHAFSQDELQHIWTKINYLTGLTFPANYDTGFIVPPFVKLTLGSIYRDQPGYIKSLSYAVEDDASWEVDGVQIPHGMTINIGFSILEKTQVRTGSPFYSIMGN